MRSTMSLRLKYSLIAGTIGSLEFLLPMQIAEDVWRDGGGLAWVIPVAILTVYLRFPAFLHRIEASLTEGELSLKKRLRLVAGFWMEIYSLVSIMLGVLFAFFFLQGAIEHSDFKSFSVALIALPFVAAVGSLIGFILLIIGIPTGLLFLKWLLADMRKQQVPQ